ncbi:porin [Paracoccus sp. SCSIO 75233]|uniref:porin n=1 Tax=Paracoccus sp. SCSIO 75233 TaxID=3017782 RepID=UPI0022F079ED|nr:porin [Paracoccus sp. SCSIO 75233]WBU53201.1 porin [Paracoccus sp. SCSIO 75233]
MKKVLFATTALVMTAGVAAADVTISGYGRAAVDYQDNRDQEATIETRVRMNFDASTTTDQGVDFGARIRMQYDDGSSNSTLSPAYIYVTSGGFEVSVGNVGTAYDSAGLIYESEVGLISRSFGNSMGDFYAFDTNGYGDEENRMGFAVKYSAGGFTGRLSYVDPDQTVSGDQQGKEEELSVAIDYEWNDLALSAAAVQNGAGIDGNDQQFVGAYYTMAGTSNGVGLNWVNNGDDATGDTIVLYGDYEVAPMTTLSAYIANNDGDMAKETDNAFGVGVKYDLGGAIVAGSIERGYQEEIRSDMGIKFNF